MASEPQNAQRPQQGGSQNNAPQAESNPANRKSEESGTQAGQSDKANQGSNSSQGGSSDQTNKSGSNQANTAAGSTGGR